MSLQTNPIDTGYSNIYATTGMTLCSSQDGVTAAGANQAAATVCFAQQINVTTVAVGTGISLPQSVAGMEIAVANNGANALLIYPALATEKVNALAAGAGFSAAVGAVTIFYCFTAGQWFTK